MRRETAEGLNKELLSYREQLGVYMLKLRDDVSHEEMGKIIEPVRQMISLSFEVLQMIWSEYPDLKPEKAKPKTPGI